MNRRTFIKGVTLGFPSIFIPQAIANPFLPILTRTPSATCSNMQIESAGTRHSDNDVGDANRLFVGMKFTTGGSGFTCCRADMPLYKLGSPTSNLLASIWTHNAGLDEPDAQASGTESATIAASSLGTTDPSGGTWSSFTGMSFVLSSATTYWLMIEVSAPGDASNMVKWVRNITVGRIARDNTAVTPWSIDSTTRTAMHRLFSS